MTADQGVPEIEERDTFTISEAAWKLRISKNSAYAAAKRGELPTIRLGGRLLVPKNAFARLLRGEAMDAAGQK